MNVCGVGMMHNEKKLGVDIESGDRKKCERQHVGLLLDTIHEKKNW